MHFAGANLHPIIVAATVVATQLRVMDDVAFVFVPTLLLLVVRIASVAVSGEVEKFKVR